MGGVDYIIVQTKQEKGSHTFQLLPVSKGVEQTGYPPFELPSTVDEGHLVVVKDAYTILYAIKNA